MNERKKTTLIRLGVILGIVLLAGILYICGVFTDNAHFFVINRADDDIYEFILRISYTGDVQRDEHSQCQVSGKLKNFQNEHYPIPYGEKIPMETGHREDVAIGDRAQIMFYVLTDQRQNTPSNVIGTPIANTPMEIPLAKGKSTVLILTGNKESGYYLTCDGLVNWVFG